MRRALAVCSFLALVALAASFLAWSDLPDPMPVHWGVDGQPDGWGSRLVGTLLLPGMMLGVPLLVAGLLRLDPRKRHVADSQGAVALILGGLSGFLLVLHLLSLWSVTSGQPLSMRGLLVAMGGLMVVIGAAMPRLQSNFFAGIRTPWTLSSETVWRATHRLAGWTTASGGLVAVAAGLLLPPPVAFGVGLAAALLGSLLPLPYSYLLWRREQAAA